MDAREEYAQRVGQAIVSLRLYRDMTQAELARAADLSPSSLSRYESGDSPIPAFALAEVARVLRVPVELIADPAGSRHAVIVAAAAWDEVQGRRGAPEP